MSASLSFRWVPALFGLLLDALCGTSAELPSHSTLQVESVEMIHLRNSSMLHSNNGRLYIGKSHYHGNIGKSRSYRKLERKGKLTDNTADILNEPHLAHAARKKLDANKVDFKKYGLPGYKRNCKPPFYKRNGCPVGDRSQCVTPKGRPKCPGCDWKINGRRNECMGMNDAFRHYVQADMEAGDASKYEKRDKKKAAEDEKERAQKEGDAREAEAQRIKDAADKKKQREEEEERKKELEQKRKDEAAESAKEAEIKKKEEADKRIERETKKKAEIADKNEKAAEEERKKLAARREKAREAAEKLRILEDKFNKDNEDGDDKRKKALDKLKKAIDENKNRLKDIVGWLPSKDQAAWESKPGIWEPLFKARHLAQTLFDEHGCRDHCGCQACEDDKRRICEDDGHCKLDGENFCVLEAKSCAEFTCPEGRRPNNSPKECHGSTCNYVCCDDLWPEDYVTLHEGSGGSSFMEQLTMLAREHLLSTERLDRASKVLYDSFRKHASKAGGGRANSRPAKLAKDVMAAERLLSLVLGQMTSSSMTLTKHSQDAGESKKHQASAEGFLHRDPKS
eukprot:gnl/MRDRNA2_/MRDRNA2_101816_c0_seq1.p1 gnl/MRDRNA2_/MRDRNA2_101816_c0~~gnl/MRDRNA2_/MRDRNA2_101816_c0_seq1.p1  ORF type:complete len:567 (-),score=161.10 gnl/MRDRNA2_/MRDRNA2_101816_c0_seq1:41-1741(-)